MELRSGRVSGKTNKGYKIVKNNTIVLSPQNLWLGNINVNDYGMGLVSPSYKTFDIKIDASFLKPILRTNKMLFQYRIASTQGASVVRRNLDMNLFNQIYLKIPTTKEQEKIGKFFENLDSLIVLHQRKLDLLKKLKQGYLQQLFPKNGESKPALRFADFHDDWEQRKLGDITKRVTRKNKNLITTRPLTISAQFGLIDQNVFFNKQIASKDVSGYFLIYNGEFAYNKSYSNDYPWGAVKRLDKYDNGVLSTLYIVFKPTNINSDFLVSYYENNGWYREISKNATEGARNHGLLNISPMDFLNMKLVIPILNTEQNKIGTFLKKIDNSITLHQRKLDKLNKLKQGYLQKLFI